ncbi:hypothetical protein FBU31_007820, partial [Coemansia sp. 'formosensis']
KASKPPGFEPFVCRSAQSPFSSAKEQTTPLLSRSRKRQIEEQGSPALAMYMNSPTAASWARKQQLGRGSRGGSMLTSNSAGAPSLGLFRRESLNTDDESSFDDDGSLTNLPRMRGLGLKKRVEEPMMNYTPSRPNGGSIKRARSQVTGIANGFQPILEEQD